LKKTRSLYLLPVLRSQRPASQPASQPNRVYKRILYLQKCAKKTKIFSKVFTLKAGFGELNGSKGDSCFGVFLIGVLSEQKATIHDLGETLPRLLATLFPTVTSQAKNREKKSCFVANFHCKI
jgi:hypothetical protein